MATITDVNVGTLPNDWTWDTLRDGFIKINTNTNNLNNDKLEWPSSAVDWNFALFDWDEHCVRIHQYVLD